ncbi:hypothetical protein G6F58_013798 [Rhizopus delemar]|nr:hypothetical protein G6F58_013798 [Rhizopus delemar]
MQARACAQRQRTGIDQRAAGEVQRIVEALEADDGDRGQEHHDGDRHGDMAPAHEVDLGVMATFWSFLRLP